MASSSPTDLSSIWLFSSCSAKELRRLRRASTDVTVPKGTELVKEGGIGREFFLILEGSASVRRNKRRVTTLGPGQYFGELALLDRRPRSASVVAETDMRLLVLTQREFAGVLEDIPSLSRKLLTTMAARLREADARAFH